MVGALALEVDLSDEALPHMAIADGRFEGAPARVARVSFSGDRSYEISVPAGRALSLWRRMVAAGREAAMIPIGLEAMSLLRAEKGFIIIGKDTDGTTMPHDLGVTGPRDGKAGEYVGKRSLFTEAALAPDRRQLVGLAVTAGEAPLPTGAHAIEIAGGRRRSIGYVTSSYFSPTLGRPIALGLVENGMARLGEEIEVYHLRNLGKARIAALCALDPEGVRLRL
jgi:sarcosine oxidase subunit alpha